MIVRKTTILECWCSNCSQGQMEAILDRSFKDKKPIEEYIGEKFICPNCKAENTLEDVLELIPQEFVVFSQSEKSTIKSNTALLNWLNKDEKHEAQNDKKTNHKKHD